jgi:ribosomal protein S27E
MEIFILEYVINMVIEVYSDNVLCPNCNNRFFTTIFISGKQYTTCPHCHEEFMQRLKIEVQPL